ncbi:MAG: hypothetical protein AAGC85_26760, partial [Bacteroidota bacterium]
MSRVAVEQIQTYAGHKGAIFALCADEENHCFYSAADDGIVVKWSLDKDNNTGEGILSVGRAVYALSVIPEKKQLWVGASDGKVYVVDTESRKLISTLSAHTHAIYQLKYEPTHSQMWVLAANGWLNLIDTENLGTSFSRQIHTKNLRSLVFHLDKAFIGSSDHTIR